MSRRALILVVVFKASRSRQQVHANKCLEILEKLLGGVRPTVVVTHEKVPSTVSAQTASQTYNYAHLTHQYLSLLTPFLKK